MGVRVSERDLEYRMTTIHDLLDEVDIDSFFILRGGRNTSVPRQFPDTAFPNARGAPGKGPLTGLFMTSRAVGAPRSGYE